MSSIRRNYLFALPIIALSIVVGSLGCSQKDSKPPQSRYSFSSFGEIPISNKGEDLGELSMPVWADVDGDGDLDLAITTGTSRYNLSKKVIILENKIPQRVKPSVLEEQ